MKIDWHFTNFLLWITVGFCPFLIAIYVGLVIYPIVQILAIYSVFKAKQQLKEQGRKIATLQEHFEDELGMLNFFVMVFVGIMAVVSAVLWIHLLLSIFGIV